MHNIQNKSRSYSGGETFLQTGDARDGIEAVKAVIKEASKVDIVKILRSYSIDIDDYEKKVICPLHQENSASFYVYRDTNSFYCWGCKAGGDSVEFVSRIEDISRYKAARKLLDRFEPTQDFQERNEVEFAARTKLIIGFSSMIREFIMNNADDRSAIDYADKICLIFDKINDKHSLDIEGIQSLIAKLTHKLKDYGNSNTT